jgi:hypothetical protein
MSGVHITDSGAMCFADLLVQDIGIVVIHLSPNSITDRSAEDIWLTPAVRLCRSEWSPPRPLDPCIFVVRIRSWRFSKGLDRSQGSLDRLYPELHRAATLRQPAHSDPSLLNEADRLSGSGIPARWRSSGGYPSGGTLSGLSRLHRLMVARLRPAVS